MEHPQVADLIQVVDVAKSYVRGRESVRIFDCLSMRIEEGDFLAIMGPSGSGKSTLLHILGLLDEATSGTYRLKGKEVHTYQQGQRAYIRNREIGFVFQSFNLLSKTSVINNVKLPLFYSDIKEKEWGKKALDAVEAVGLSPRKNHEPSQLSGGEKQRVAIARALVMDPDLIFADEPTGNLDTKSGENIIEILQQLNDAGKTIILITHETYIAEHAKRIIHLRDGKLEQDNKLSKRRRANGISH